MRRIIPAALSEFSLKDFEKRKSALWYWRKPEEGSRMLIRRERKHLRGGEFRFSEFLTCVFTNIESINRR